MKVSLIQIQLYSLDGNHSCQELHHFDGAISFRVEEIQTISFFIDTDCISVNGKTVSDQGSNVDTSIISGYRQNEIQA